MESDIHAGGTQMALNSKVEEAALVLAHQKDFIIREELRMSKLQNAFASFMHRVESAKPLNSGKREIQWTEDELGVMADREYKQLELKNHSKQLAARLSALERSSNFSKLLSVQAFSDCSHSFGMFRLLECLDLKPTC